MKLKYLSFMASAFLATAFLASCSSDDVVQNGQDNNNGNNGNVTGVIFEGATQTPTSRAQVPISEAPDGVITSPYATTRTTATHSVGNGAKVAWETTDHIWVKDDAGTFQQSSGMTFPTSSNQSYAKFGLTTGSFTNATHQVVYTGKNSTSATTVEIKANQTQTGPNNFDHLGESGDCGIATATADAAGNYGFTLQHKAAYLCLLPRSANEVFQRCKLTKIVITSDQDIAGKFSLSTSGLSAAPIANASKTITLTTGSGFDLDNSTTNVSKNGSYVVIAPGTYSLVIKYWLKDPVTGKTGTVTKGIDQHQYEAGKIHDITSNLDTRVWNNIQYAMWDAKQPLLYDYETEQRLGITYSSYPTSNADPRWYNEAGGPTTPTIASNLCKDQPNFNEMRYYFSEDRYEDDDELTVLRNNLYKAVMYLKKSSKIPGFSSTTPAVSSYGNDYSGNPDPSEFNDYFALPDPGRAFLDASNNIVFREPDSSFAYWMSEISGSGTGPNCAGVFMKLYGMVTYSDHFTSMSKSSGYAILKFE